MSRCSGSVSRTVAAVAPAATSVSHSRPSTSQGWTAPRRRWRTKQQQPPQREEQRGGAAMGVMGRHRGGCDGRGERGRHGRWAIARVHIWDGGVRRRPSDLHRRACGRPRSQSRWGSIRAGRRPPVPVRVEDGVSPHHSAQLHPYTLLHYHLLSSTVATRRSLRVHALCCSLRLQPHFLPLRFIARGCSLGSALPAPTCHSPPPCPPRPTSAGSPPPHTPLTIPLSTRP